MKISDIKFNVEKILDNNKAQNIISINLKNKSYIAVNNTLADHDFASPEMMEFNKFKAAVIKR